MKKLLKIFARKVALPAVVGLGMEKRFSASVQPGGIIVNFHGVTPGNGADFTIRHCSAAFFEKHLQYFKKNFEVVGTDEMFRFVQEGRQFEKPMLAITLDDGYLNNHRQVVPLLEKYEIPATFFIITSPFVKPNHWMWADGVDFIINRLGQSKIAFPEVEFSAENHWKHPESGQNIYSWLKEIPAAVRDEAMDKIERDFNLLEEFAKIPEEHWKFMSPEQVVDANRSKFVRIGAHTHWHYCLAHVSDEVRRTELQTSKEKLEAILQEPVEALAFPDGSYNDRVKELSREAGFKELYALKYKEPSDQQDKSVLCRLGLSNTTTWQSNMVFLHRNFAKFRLQK